MDSIVDSPTKRAKMNLNTVSIYPMDAAASLAELPEPRSTSADQLVFQENISAAGSSAAHMAQIIPPDLATTNVSAITECFSQDFSIPSFRSDNKKKELRRISYDIYPLSKLNDLLQEKNRNQEKPDLRFIVCSNLKAWFARESHSGIPAPAHYKMTGDPQNQARCITAGNIYFSDDYTKIIKINHKSGDFRPSLDSLKWFIALLIMHEGKLSVKFSQDLLMIDQLNSSGGVLRTLHWDINQVRQWVKNSFKPGRDHVERLLDQPDNILKVCYGPDGVREQSRSRFSLFASEEVGELPTCPAAHSASARKPKKFDVGAFASFDTSCSANNEAADQSGAAASFSL